jgi:hypothetical protein
MNAHNAGVRKDARQMPNHNPAKSVQDNCRLVTVLFALTRLESVLKTGHLIVYSLLVVSYYLQPFNLIRGSFHIPICLNYQQIGNYRNTKTIFSYLD